MFNSSIFMLYGRIARLFGAAAKSPIRFIHLVRGLVLTLFSPKTASKTAEKASLLGSHAPQSHEITALAHIRSNISSRPLLLRLTTIPVALLAVSCLSPHGAFVTDVDAVAWSEPAEIELTNRDTTSLRDMELFLRCNKNFAEDTLTVRIALLSPDSLRYEEPFRLVIPPLRTPSSLQSEANIPYRHRIQLSRSGTYRLSVTPLREVRGVEAVGINLTKSN